MTDFQKYISALRKCAKEHENDKTPTFNIRVSDLCRDTARLLEELEQEPKTGYWIKSRDCYGNNHFTCPFCEHDIATKADTLGDNYCSNCGAKLQESEVSNDFQGYR